MLVVGLADAEGIQFSTLSIEDVGVENLQPLVRMADDSCWPKFSMDGGWLALVHEELDRAALSIQRFLDRATLGPRVRVPTLDGEVPWDFVWSRDPELGRNEFLMIAVDRRSIYAVPLEDEATGRFGSPRLVTTVEGAYISELQGLGDGRALLILQDPEEQELDRISIVIGGLTAE